MSAAFRYLMIASAVVASAQPADEATVKADAATVYEKASAKSTVVATLVQRQTVKILYSLMKGDGNWCEVRAGAVSGYVLCERLDWPGGVRADEPVRAAAPPVELPARAVSMERHWVIKGPKPKGGVEELRQFNYDPVYWGLRLDFTPAQWDGMAELLRRNEVAACFDSLREWLRGRGISNPAEFSTAVNSGAFLPVLNEAQARFGECSARLKYFWLEFPFQFSPEQKRTFEKDRQRVSNLTGFGEQQVRMVFQRQ